MNIEPLEARIAPAILFNYLDIDGDFVTVSISKGNSGDAIFTLSTPTAAGTLGDQLKTIDLQGDIVFDGANITVTAKRSDSNSDGILDGDGVANVGYINANGINLGSVSVSGDLGKLLAGADDGRVALKSLSVGSLGVQGTSAGAPDVVTAIFGSLGTAKIKGDLDQAYLTATGGIGSVTVGGSIIGGISDREGAIYATGNLGPVTVKGDVTGARGDYSGSIGAGGNVGNVTIGGSLLGGSGTNSGTIYSAFNNAPVGTMGAIKIGHDLSGGASDEQKNGVRSGRIVAGGSVTSITIGGSVQSYGGADSAQIVIGGDAGSISIGGSLIGEFGASSGSIAASMSTIKSLSIGGSVKGGFSDFSGNIEAQGIGTLRIGGDLAGDRGSFSGRVNVGSGGIGAATIVGSIVGGTDPDDGSVLAVNSGFLLTSGSLTKLTIGGSIVGSNATGTGRVSVYQNLGSVTVGGDVSGGSGSNSGTIDVLKNLGLAAIRGSIRGGTVSDTGFVRAGDSLGKITVGGSVVGGLSNSGSHSGVIEVTNGRLGSVSITGDLLGNFGFQASGSNNGVILARQAGSITLGGSIIAGGGGGVNPLSGAIAVDEEIGSILIKGNVTGGGVQAKIYAGASATAPAAKNIAIKSLTIGGNVDYAYIFAGVTRTGGALSGDAQIGAVKVGGQWKNSSLASGATSAGATIGDGNDTFIGANPHSKIASIVIGGPVLGVPGGTSTSGFFAHEIGSFKYNGLAVALQAGAGNDLFGPAGSSKAKAVGPSTSPVTAGKPDGYAVHVFEV